MYDSSDKPTKRDARYGEDGKDWLHAVKNEVSISEKKNCWDIVHKPIHGNVLNTKSVLNASKDWEWSHKQE